ncbi:hypothetical protein GCM10010112_30280 [Actinoplanes lobatus]|nr:hypothetical protein GCM10010112_30280 [Actinoplanes lobatus]
MRKARTGPLRLIRFRAEPVTPGSPIATPPFSQSLLVRTTPGDGMGRLGGAIQVVASLSHRIIYKITGLPA